MICIKLNTTEDIALDALDFLSQQGYKSIGSGDRPTCVVYWGDGEYSAENEHEGVSALVKETLIFDKLEDFIKAVNCN